jgi:phospholipid-binding lipoprotein MlaA
MKFRRTSSYAAILALTAASVLGGCATSGNPRDPIEGFNRAIFDINDGLDKALVKPIAQGYASGLPAPVRQGVTNFFSNIDDLFIATNNLLQGKLPEAASDVGRVAVNTTIGLLGVMDVASSLGLEKHDEDFGQTLGRWGVGSGPYLVLPFFGSSTLRDAGGLVVNLAADPVGHVHDVPVRNGVLVTRVINDRANYLPAEKIVEEAALDRYSYMRDAYLQSRRYRIYDGDPPREQENAAEALLRQPDQLLTVAAGFELVSGSANLYVERPVEAVSISLADARR